MKEACSENSLLVRVFSNGANGFMNTKRTLKMTNVQVNLSLFLETETVTKIKEIVCGDRHMSSHIIIETVNTDKETDRKILHDKLNEFVKNGRSCGKKNY